VSLFDRRGLFWQLHTAGWLAFSSVYIVATLQVLPVWHAAADKAAFGGSGFVVSLGLWRVCRAVRHWPWPWLIVAVCMACYAGGLVWSALYGWIVIATGWSSATTWWPRLGGSLAMSGTLLAWCGLYFGAVYARELEHRQEDLAREREHALAARGELRAAQLRALRYQLDPHFLFNTLNAVSTLVAERHTEAAQTTIARLADFLRATLEDRDAPEISLARELELVDRYLAIERVRLQERLQVHIEASEAALHARVPALLLQPLVENAVRHGIARRQGAGRLELRASRSGSRLHIVVRDASAAGGDGDTRAAHAPLGLGLANTRARLTVLFDSDFDLSMEAGADATEVRIDLPFRGAAALGRAS
jgi:hypothetical protein